MNIITKSDNILPTNTSDYMLLHCLSLGKCQNNVREPHAVVSMQAGTLSFVTGIDLCTSHKLNTPLPINHSPSSCVHHPCTITSVAKETVTICFAMSHMWRLWVV